ncbi:TPA: hypothetical protein ENS27_15385 [bacterium]|nr:hypothetical protein [bacterium]
MSNISAIIVSKEANEVEIFSANELSNYLGIMTNDQIKITNIASGKCLYVGFIPDNAEYKNQLFDELADLHDDGFIIRAYGDDIIIKGKNSRGTLYGVYEYLNRLGARWYFPGKEHEFIPKRDDIFINGIDIKESPDFNHRSICIHIWEKGFEHWVDFAGKAKLNAIHLHSDEGLDDMEKLAKNRGLDYNFRRHFFGEKYSPEDKSDLDANRKLIKDYIKILPDKINDFFLWPADVVLQIYDNPENWSIADITLMFTNEMAKAIKEIKPKGRMSFLSYWTTWGVPKNIKPLDNVFLEIAHMHQCYSHSITDHSCQTNSKEVMPDIDGLMNVFDPSETHVLGYWLDASLFGRGVYKGLEGRLPYIGNNIRQDFLYYKSKGIKNISTFAVGLNSDYFVKFISPTIFQYSALLWNIKYDLDLETRLFCENYFGETQLSSIFSHTEHIDPRYKGTEAWNELADYLKKSMALINKVLKDTKNDLYIMRLNKLLREFEHVEKWMLSA